MLFSCVSFSTMFRASTVILSAVEWRVCPGISWVNSIIKSLPVWKIYTHKARISMRQASCLQSIYRFLFVPPGYAVSYSNFLFCSQQAQIQFVYNYPFSLNLMNRCNHFDLQRVVVPSDETVPPPLNPYLLSATVHWRRSPTQWRSWVVVSDC